MPPSPLPLTAIILANLGALAGVAFGWNLKTLAMLYCIEIAIVGVFGAVKVYLATERGELGKSKGYQVIFFITHYATFCVMYTFGLVYFLFPSGAGYAGPLFLLPGAAMLFAGSHGVSFKFTYWDRREFERVGSLPQMLLPYARVAPAHVVLVAGVLLWRALGEPVWMPWSVAVVKIGADAFAHRAVHDWIAKCDSQRTGAPSPVDSPPTE